MSARSLRGCGEGRAGFWLILVELWTGDRLWRTLTLYLRAAREPSGDGDRDVFFVVSSASFVISTAFSSPCCSCPR